MPPALASEEATLREVLRIVLSLSGYPRVADARGEGERPPSPHLLAAALLPTSPAVLAHRTVAERLIRDRYPLATPKPQQRSLIWGCALASSLVTVVPLCNTAGLTSPAPLGERRKIRYPKPVVLLVCCRSRRPRVP
jgi:hypothetical protein